MNGLFLRFYTHESQRHQDRFIWEWLLEEANKIGIRGGSAFKAIGGFGRHHTLHEAKFFELAGTLAIEVEFIVTTEEAKNLLDAVRREKITIFYASIPAQFGVLTAGEDLSAAS